AIWPVQKCTWKDCSGEQGKTYKYEIVPMVGTPDKLTAREDLAATTNSVTLTTEHGDFSCAFTSGILSTQWLAHTLPQAKDGSGPDWEALVKAIKTPGDPIREKLCGVVQKMLMAPV